MDRHASDAPARIELIRAAVEAGLTSIDTAPLYGFGGAERLVGRAVADCRERVQLLTKVGLTWDDEHGDVMFEAPGADGGTIRVRKDSRPERVLRDVDESLERLGVETLDLVQVHQRDRHTPVAETVSALRDCVQAGKVRAVGVSNFDARDTREAIRALGEIPLASIQPEYSLLRRSCEVDLLPLAREEGLGVLAYSPLAQGFLASRAGPRLARDDLRARGPLGRARTRAGIARAVAGHLGPVAERRGVTPGAVALAWLLAQPAVAGVIVGVSNVEQIRANAGALRLDLAPDEVAAIRRGFEALHLDLRPPGGLRRRLRRWSERWRNRSS